MTIMRSEAQAAAATAAPGGRPTGTVNVASRILVTIVVIGVWALLYTFGLSRLQQTRDQHSLYDALRIELARGTAPVSAPIATGKPVALLQIPAAGVHDEVVSEGTDSTQLNRGPGHLRSTPLPGQVGVSVLMGRRLTFGAPFADLDHLHRGDPITVTTGAGVQHFAVIGTHTGTTVRSTIPSGTAGLTLVTAADGALGQVSSSTVFWVDAVKSGRPLAVTVALPAAGGDELPLRGDGSLVTKLELAFALQLLALALIAVVWATARWGRRQAWTVGVPLVILSLWLVSGIATRLLPNLI